MREASLDLPPLPMPRHGSPAGVEEHLEPRAAPRGARDGDDRGARSARLRRHAHMLRALAKLGVRFERAARHAWSGAGGAFP